MAETIGLRAILEDDDFQQGVSSYNKGIDVMEAANKNAIKSSADLVQATDETGEGLEEAGEELEEAGNDALDMAAKLVMNEVKDLAKAGLELAELGAQSKRVEQRFEAFSEQAGGATEILEAFQEGAGGTVSKMEAMDSATRLLQMGLVTNADEMQRVVEMATRLGDQTATAGARVGDFALLLANQSIPRLDNFGISSGTVRARIAELQAETKDMTREAAFMQAVMESGADSLAILGDRVDDDAAAFEKAEAKMADMRVEMGQKLAPIAAKLMGVLADLDTGTLALITGFGTLIGVLVRFRSVLKGAQGQALITNSMLAGLGITVAALAVTYEAYNRIASDVNEVQKEAVAAADSLSESIAKQVDAGVPLEVALRKRAVLLDEQVRAWDDNLITGTAIGGLFGSHSKLLEILNEAHSEFNQATLEGTSTWDEYVKILDAVNATITDSDAKIKAMTEGEYKLAKGIGAAAAELSNYDIIAREAAIAEQGLKEIHTLSVAELDKIDIAYADADARMLKYANDMMNQLTPAQQAAWREGRLLMQQQEETAQEMEDMEDAIADLTVRLETTYFESVKRAAEVTDRLEKEQAEAAQAAQDHAVSLLDLAEGLSDASAADAAHAAISNLKGLLKDKLITTEQYTEAVSGVQEAYGLVTDKGDVLSTGIDVLGQMFGDGTITPLQYQNALQDLTDAAGGLEEGITTVPEILEGVNTAFGRAGTAVEEDFANKVDLGFADAQDTVEQGADNLPAAMDKMPRLFSLAGIDATDELHLEMKKGFEETGLEVQEGASKLPENLSSLTPGMRKEGELASDGFSEGIDLGFSSAKRKTRATVEDLSETISIRQRFQSSGADASDGFTVGLGGGLDTAHSETSNMMGDELPSTMDGLPADFERGGRASGTAFMEGLNASMDEAAAAMRAKLQIIKDLLPESEPADTSSPLYNLSASGLAIINNMMEGVNAAEPGAIRTMAGVGDALGTALSQSIIETTDYSLKDLFSAAGVLGGLGSAAAGFFKDQTLEPMEEALDDAVARMIELMERRGTDVSGGVEDAFSTFFREQIGGGGGLLQLMLKRERGELTFDETTLLNTFETLQQIDRERKQLAQDIADENERLLRLQEAQQNLRLLEQQFKLLELIQEQGLDAEAILGGLQLGLDADMGAVIDAMAAAMEAMIAAAEEELGIGSPSKVFEMIGAETMEGMARGIERLMSLPIRQSMIATRGMMSVPARVVSDRPSPILTSGPRVDMQFGDTNISNGMDMIQFETRVRRAVDRAIRGV
jgi:hypothetical protein